MVYCDPCCRKLMNIAASHGHATCLSNVCCGKVEERVQELFTTDESRDGYEKNVLSGMMDKKAKKKQEFISNTLFDMKVCKTCARVFLKCHDVTAIPWYDEAGFPECAPCISQVGHCIEDVGQQGGILHWCVDNGRYERIDALAKVWTLSTAFKTYLMKDHGDPPFFAERQLHCVLNNIPRGEATDRRLLPIMQRVNTTFFHQLRERHNFTITSVSVAKTLLMYHRQLFTYLVEAFHTDVNQALLAWMSTPACSIEGWRVNKAINGVTALVLGSNSEVSQVKTFAEQVLKDTPRKPVKSIAFLSPLLVMGGAPQHIPDWIAYHSFNAHLSNHPEYFHARMRRSFQRVQQRLIAIKNRRRRLGLLKAAVLLRVSFYNTLKKRYAPGGPIYQEAREHFLRTRRDQLFWNSFKKQ